VSFDSSEIADLLMMLVLGPIILAAIRRTAPALIRPAAVCVGLIATGYVATVIEGVALPEFFNLVEHASYAMAPLAFLWLLKVSGHLVNPRKAGAR